MVRIMWIIAGFFAMTAVIFGALGSHALKEAIPPSSLAAWQTAVSYQMFHALAILILCYHKRPSTFLNWSRILFVIGTFLFSGSIYLLSTKNLHFGESVNWLGPITPIGGFCFIFGWLFTILHAKNIVHDKGIPRL